MQPRLESWEAADHPDQVRLRTYLDYVAEHVLLEDWPPGEPRAIELTVGLPENLSLNEGGRDLDNYLHPLARKFGAGRIAAAFGRKAHQPHSTIAVGPAIPTGGPAQPPQLSVRTSMSASTLAWKEAVHQACAKVVVEPISAGPVALRIQLGVSGRRNWAELWKPTIDALGPILGIPDPKLPFRPNDDRIVDLELHRSVDDALGHDVVVRAWWHSAAAA